MYNLLVVDDEASYLADLRQILKDDNCTIIRAPNGEIGCRLAEERLPDVILMDWQMPKMDGITALQHLKANPKTTHIPVIFASGIMMSAKHLAMALNAGAVDFVRKPFEKVELLARINAVLKLAESNRKLREANQQLKESNLTKERLMAIIAHDLQSPLSSFHGTLSLIKEMGQESFGKEELLQLINGIEAEFRSVKQLTNGLLAWALHEQQAITYKAEWINLTAFIQQSLELTAVSAKGKSIYLTSALDQELFIHTDPHMLQFIIRNLLANAVKFTKAQGKVVVQAHLEEEDEILLKVIDTGMGIPPNAISQIFEGINPHKSQRDTRGKRSTGLGLAMIKEFSRCMGGRVWVESTWGKGSTFFVKLPVSLADEAVKS
ncbi:MAG: hybrid sensor histidine kinase/response regulator [Flammeovirgaceae bacterium]